MARTEARMFTSRNADEDWRGLPMGAQWLYDTLLTQTDLSHAGVLRLSLRRWSRLAASVEPAHVQAALDVLVERRFVVVDEDTEELLVRSLMRRDGTWRSHLTLKGAVASALAIESPVLRAALVEEVARIDPSDLKDPDNRATVARTLADLIAALGGPPDTPSEAPSEGVSEAPWQGGGSKPFRKGYRKPLGKGQGAGAGSGAVVTAPTSSGSQASPPDPTQGHEGDLDGEIAEGVARITGKRIDPSWAARIRCDVVGSRQVRDVLAYVLAAVEKDPQRYLPTSQPPRFSVVKPA